MKKLFLALVLCMFGVSAFAQDCYCDSVYEFKKEKRGDIYVVTVIYNSWDTMEMWVYPSRKVVISDLENGKRVTSFRVGKNAWDDENLITWTSGGKRGHIEFCVDKKRVSLFGTCNGEVVDGVFLFRNDIESTFYKERYEVKSFVVEDFQVKTDTMGNIKIFLDGQLYATFLPNGYYYSSGDVKKKGDVDVYITTGSVILFTTEKRKKGKVWVYKKRLRIENNKLIFESLTADKQEFVLW